MTTVDTIRPADHQPSEIPPAVGVGYVATNGGTTVHHDGLHRRTSSNGSIPHAHAALTHEPRATPTKFAANGGGSSLLKNWLQIRQNPDGRYDLEPICDELSFEKGFFLFVRAIQQLKAVTDETIIVGLAGPSGAGKTVFSQKVCDFIDGVVRLELEEDGGLGRAGRRVEVERHVLAGRLVPARDEVARGRGDGREERRGEGAAGERSCEWRTAQGPSPRPQGQMLHAGLRAALSAMCMFS